MRYDSFKPDAVSLEPMNESLQYSVLQTWTGFVDFFCAFFFKEREIFYV